MAYTVKNGKLTKSMKRAAGRAAKLLLSLTPEENAALSKATAGMNAVEVADMLMRRYVASEVREKLVADNMADIAAKVDEHNVIENLEALVEGDEVIDDAATHKWFRDKLDWFREGTGRVKTISQSDMKEACQKYADENGIEVVW
jgi:reverse gyrase